MCGGWNRNEHVGPSAANGDLDINSNETPILIPFVTGAPGHRFEWDGDLRSAMAKRDDTFTFPDNATGMTHVCAPETPQVHRQVWHDPIIQITIIPPSSGGGGASSKSANFSSMPDGTVIYIDPKRGCRSLMMIGTMTAYRTKRIRRPVCHP